MIGLYFLYKILKTGNADFLLRVPPKWFLLGEEKKEYKKIKKYIKDYGKLPPPPSSLPAGYEDHPLEYFFDRLKKRYCNRLISKIKAEEIPEEKIEKYLMWIEKEITELTAMQSLSYMITPDEFTSFALKTVDALRKNKICGLLGYPSGYPSLDFNTGGFISGDLFVYVARMKTGKTMYMLNSLRKLAKEHTCMFISMEMPLQSIQKRLLALELKTPNFVSQNRIIPSFLDKKIKELNLNIYLVNGASLKDISDIYSLISFYSPEIVFIDGAYLLNAGSFRSEWEKATHIVRELRLMALKTNTAFVATYQLNRQAVKSKDVEVEHIAFTDAIAQSASAVIGIVNSDNSNEKEFVILCNREGRDKIKIKVNWDWQNMNFEEIGEDISFEDVNDVELENMLLEYVNEDEEDNRNDN